METAVHELFRSILINKFSAISLCCVVGYISRMVHLILMPFGRIVEYILELLY